MSQTVQITPFRIGEPNCMKWAVDFIRRKEQSCTFTKVCTYALAFFLAFIATATVVGIFFVCKTISEYHRQGCEAAAQDASRATAVQLEARVQDANRLRDEAFDRVRELDTKIERAKTLTPKELRMWRTRGTLPARLPLTNGSLA